MTVYDDLQKIKKKLEIQEKRFVTIKDYESTVTDYQMFAESELGINSGTIRNQVSVLRMFLESVNGSITEDAVANYLRLGHNGLQK